MHCNNERYTAIQRMKRVLCPYVHKHQKHTLHDLLYETNPNVFQREYPIIQCRQLL